MPPRYVPVEEYMNMMKHVQETVAALADATDALRTVTLLMVAALAKQENINPRKFMDDISFMIENHYPPDGTIPTVVLDFRAELARRLSTTE